MCGFGALLDPAGGAPADAGRLMAAALRHRGPDGEAIVERGPATLVHRRLAIVDVAGGDQPLWSEDGTVAVVANGEIYNHEQLRAELEARGHRFATRSDCEVIVHLYEEHGDDCVRALNGIFGFAIWDDRRGRLLVARDPLGVKPVYWTVNGRLLAVASEVGALLSAGLARAEVDRVALDHYLACRFTPAPRTLFEGVSKLPAASLLVADAHGPPRVTSYRAAPAPLERGLRGEALRDELADRFLAAVQRQMMSDVPYGAFLSGGVDSAAVVAAMAARSERPPQTFTIGFPGHGDVLDERRYAAASARALGTDHHDTAMEQYDFVTALGPAVRHLEEPCGVPSASALMQLSTFAAQSVKVALSGQGADEPHGGYGRHQAALALGVLRRAGPLAAPLRVGARLLAGNERARRGARLLGEMSDAQRLVRLVETTDERLRSQLVGGAGDEAAAERTALAADVIADVGDRPLLDQALYLDTHLFLPDGLLICNDKMSMAASLEQRVPFLDVALMRFVESIPARERVGPRAGKRLHRAAMARLLPAAISKRPKHGFSTPYDRWLRESLGDEVARRYAPGEPVAELLDSDTVGGLVAAHRGRTADHKVTLYCLLELSEWHRTFVEDVVAQPARVGGP
jgi:asparagine synthase (glutamine-hydrolysing)